MTPISKRTIGMDLKLLFTYNFSAKANYDMGPKCF